MRRAQARVVFQVLDFGRVGIPAGARELSSRRRESFPSVVEISLQREQVRLARSSLFRKVTAVRGGVAKW
jgi:hypothetical protein